MTKFCENCERGAMCSFCFQKTLSPDQLREYKMESAKSCAYAWLMSGEDFPGHYAEGCAAGKVIASE